MNAIIQQAFPGAAPVPIIPETAPFTPAQRAWLNGFLAGLYGGSAGPANASATPPAPAEDFPWHDPALELGERLALAEGRPLPRRLMAAMAQLDCGQCGYLCKTYAEAIASGAESSLALCVPGAKATQKALKALLAEAPAAVAKPAPSAPAKPAGVPVRFVSASRLTGAASDKDVRHVVLDLSGSGLAYEPGDSLSVAAPNDPALVAAVIAALRADPEAEVQAAGAARPLREALAHHLDIARPLDRTLDLLAGAATHAPHAAALRALADGDDGAQPDSADLLDLLEAFPSARPPLQALLDSLPALKPRLYSIASSPLAVPDRVDLCIGVVREERRGRWRDGIASTHLAYRATPEAPLMAQVQTSHFRLPADAATPVIMVGPGTGIAPFRAFLQHRAALGQTGRSWLFFGDRHRATDFLFADEIEGWRGAGVLTRLSLAWSRDGRAKDYVQHRMAEEAADLWRWLQDGAHFYVCGDASRMAKDVDAALRAIARSEGGLDADQARDWIVALARQGRYQRDVY
ncbi:sulfite reductase subunit alpha [Roseomonas eburnea]|uniref:assimilatory sulfite reductase (NADPH) n=1 Tax=Neoroseomonas eburnea TaxID=1346889 RepID=A0A9X9XB06_9PROT|nr:sulfite reductase subunit alpha [Neoroseomonas eburnea]MBR0680892.1 sulfite reductase subunit alpha [Neoroseomonas eburnea]